MYIIYFLYTSAGPAMFCEWDTPNFMMLTPSECIWMVPGTVECDQ